MSMSQEELVRNETGRLISADKVEGTAVYGPDRERIGEVQKLMIDKRGGTVSYAVMSFGGFLGIGEKYHPLPWDQLEYSEELDGYLVSLTRDQLESGPSYEAGREPDWDDPKWGAGLRRHYAEVPGAAPI